MDPETVKLLAQYTLPTVAVGEAFAIVYLFKELMKTQREHIETAVKIAPVAQKLAEGVDALERMWERRLERDRAP